MFEQERRKSERRLVSPPITAQVEQRPVRVVNIGSLGTTIEHDSPLVGGPQKLKFQWDEGPVPNGEVGRKTQLAIGAALESLAAAAARAAHTTMRTS